MNKATLNPIFETKPDPRLKPKKITKRLIDRALKIIEENKKIEEKYKDILRPQLSS